MKDAPAKPEKDAFDSLADCGWSPRNEKVFSPEGEFDPVEIERDTLAARRGNFDAEESTGTAKKPGNGRKIDIYNTARRYVMRGEFSTQWEKDKRHGNLAVIFLVDSSGSMSVGKQISHAKKIIGETVRKNRGKTIEFTGVAILDDGAAVFSPPGRDTEKLISRLAGLKTGGRTNMSAGIEIADKIVRKNKNGKRAAAVHIFTDGRINFCESGGDPFEDSVIRLRRLTGKHVSATVVDTEAGFVRIGAAKKFAERTGASYIRPAVAATAVWDVL